MARKACPRHRCDECHRLFSEAEMRYDVDPFNEEINGATEPKVWLCDACYQESCDDI